MAFVVSADEDGIVKASEYLKDGGLVAFPTETVYGLGADAFNDEAVKKIFKVKGRPQDNPLILHIANKKDIEKIADDIPGYVYELIDKFWPGPLSVILKRKSSVPNSVTAGLDTVAIRFPKNRIANELIKRAGTPIAAPSANISGRPSPTTFEDVYYDLSDKDICIIKGEKTDIGIESTVVLATEYPPVILRPGGVTSEDIEKLVGCVKTDNRVTEKPLSPGQKYGHYMAKKNTVLVDLPPEQTDKVLDRLDLDAIYILSDENKKRENSIVLGSYYKPEEASQKYFHALRQADLMEGKYIVVQVQSKTGIGSALYERMVKSAKRQILEDEDEDWIW